jgi:formylglycine-generating enzyme required for sulfatase activity
MELIPSGTFSMGYQDLPTARRAGREEHVASFCLDRLEVSSGRHAACVQAGACKKPLTGGLCTFERAGAASRPINCVTWREAHAYCAWASKRLPTEAEWEYAARGTDGRLFPWGASPPGKRACWDGHGNDLGHGNRHELCPVGSYPDDRSPFGILDMAGSVSEWTALRPDEPAPAGRRDGSAEHARRGGSWGTKQSPFQVRVTSRGAGKFEPYRDGIFIGFRCASGPG